MNLSIFNFNPYKTYIEILKKLKTVIQQQIFPKMVLTMMPLRKSFS